MTHEELERLNYHILPCEESDLEYLSEKLEAERYLHVPPMPEAQEEDIVLIIAAEDGTVIAGCITEIDNWNVAELGVLWVDAQYRKRGLGSALVRETERLVKEKGCYLVTLDTCDFQGKPFYEKQGYSLCGTIENSPRGHCDNIMMKRLDLSSEKDALAAPPTETRFAIKLGTKEDRAFLGDKLMEYNVSQAPESYDGEGYVSLGKKITTADGTLIALCDAGFGLCRDASFDLWVEEGYRKQGFGSYLLREIERDAKEKGAYLMDFGAFDWQVEFFQKNGYAVCSTTEDCPKGHKFFVLRKEL